MRKSIFNLALVGGAAIFSANVIFSSVLAQSVELKKQSALNPADKAASIVEVEYGFADLDGLSGGQFRVHYDSELMGVADLSGCLKNVPETHAGSFSVCNDVPDQGFVQFVVLDFGRNNPVGDGVLGSIKFMKKPGSKSNVQDAVSIQDIRLAGPDGGHLKPPSQSRDGVRLQIVR